MPAAPSHWPPHDGLQDDARPAGLALAAQVLLDEGDAAGARRLLTQSPSTAPPGRRHASAARVLRAAQLAEAAR